MAGWLLNVVYPTGPDGYYWGSLDPAVVTAVGKLDCGRGTTTDSARRELSFYFGSESAARNARRRVLNLHHRGVRTEVVRT